MPWLLNTGGPDNDYSKTLVEKQSQKLLDKQRMEGPSALRAAGELWKAGWPLGTSVELEGPKEALSS